jgi:hypothetical protein
MGVSYSRMDRFRNYPFGFMPNDNFYPSAPPPSAPPAPETKPTTESAVNLRMDDGEWNRTLFPTEKSRILFQVFEKMQPCINKCIFSRFGNVNEMLLNYCYVYDEVHCIIVKNMKTTGYPPSVFSAAVHQYVMHRNLNKDPTWRVLSGVFEYTAMEIAAEISLKAKEVKKNENEAAKTISWWLWNRGADDSSMHPHEMIKETHAKVHSSHDKLEELDDKLQKRIDQIRTMKG